MGARCLTVFEDKNEEIAVIYRQMDGYLDGHGLDLAKMYSGMTIVNGISDNQKVFNGIGCLAAQTVANLKTRPGGIYLHKAGTRDVGEDYIYTVYGEIGDEPMVLVSDSHKVIIYDGTASNLKKFIESQQEES